jgi:choline-sulfatase
MNLYKTVALSALLLLLTPLASCAEPQLPNVLIITVDTLRADYLGIYGDSTAKTPNIDELARTATLFERAAAPMPLTRPSHFSLLTAKYPREHGVVNNAMALPDEAISVTEIFSDMGYATAAFLSVGLLDKESGGHPGFDAYDASGGRYQRRAEETVPAALSWLEGLSDDQPFFLWVHLFDPHIPYAPPQEFRPAAVAEAEDVTWPRLNRIAGENNENIPAEILEQAKQLYRGEIAYTDHWIGKLLDGVDGRFQPENTIVVFTADHGECFENGSYFEHSDCLFEPAIRIPLLVRFPQAFEPGTRVDAQASIIDIAPTLLRATGGEIPEEFSGRPLQDSAEFGERYVIIQHPFYQGKLVRVRPRRRRNIQSVGGEPRKEMLVDQEQVGVVGGGFKYLRSGSDEMLFRIAPETDERQNLAELDPDARSRMLDQLRRALASHGLEMIAPSEINEELLETLEALGYLDN